MMRWDSISPAIAEAMRQDLGIKLRFFLSQGRNLSRKSASHRCFRRTAIPSGQEESYNLNVVTEQGQTFSILEEIFIGFFSGEQRKRDVPQLLPELPPSFLRLMLRSIGVSSDNLEYRNLP
jgi:hypothetical protein